jgi:hypothetical protein
MQTLSALREKVKHSLALTALVSSARQQSKNSNALSQSAVEMLVYFPRSPEQGSREWCARMTSLCGWKILG